MPFCNGQPILAPSPVRYESLSPFLLYVDVLSEYLLSRLLAFTAANTRVFRVSPAMGMDSC